MAKIDSKPQAFIRGAITVLPLTLSVIPWGILAGSYALEVGLSPIESQAMSAIIFGGAVQLAVLGMLNAGAGLLSMLVTAALITSRHLLYSMAMRSRMSPLPLRWRLLLGFLLTDELFAITPNSTPQSFNRWQALGGGLSFYLGWNTATLLGILAGQTIPNLDEWGLDFAMAATFIALVIPAIKDRSVVACVLISLITAVVCDLFNIQGGLMIAALSGMAVGYLVATFWGRAA